MVDDLIREWYCMRGDRVEGPYALADLRRMLETGAMSSADMVRQGEAGTWVALRTVLEPRGNGAPPVAERLDVPRERDRERETREREPKVALDAPFSEWGLSSLILGSTLLLLTPLSLATVHQIHERPGNRFLSFLLTFVMQLLLFLGNGASLAGGVLGLLEYFKQRQRLPLNLAGTVVSALSLLLWLVTAIVMIRMMD
jgi:hypothetical protein